LIELLVRKGKLYYFNGQIIRKVVAFQWKGVVQLERGDIRTAEEVVAFEKMRMVLICRVLL
jgi:hypothetical protein